MDLEKLTELPPLALAVFGATLAVIFGIRYLGIWQGENSSPAASASTAQVAAVIVDPTALNKATDALNAHTRAVVEMTDVAGGIARSMSTMAIEMDRIREELRIQREINRR